jgi:hypothetical protein
MEFCLHYSGKLKSRDTAAGKHHIRKALHSQLKALCESERMRSVFESNTQDVKEGRGKPLYVEHDSKRFWFLISEHLSTAVDISVTMLVPHEVARIVHNGGDIDNRIKTLFDALRVPAAPSEVPASDSFDYSAGGMYCLLQDDKLIDRVSLRSYQDYAPVGADTVTALIEVKTKVLKALWGNFEFF